LAVQRAYQYAYEEAPYRSVSIQKGPQVTQTYLHGQWVQSRFKKHASKAQSLFFSRVFGAILFGLCQAVWTTTVGVHKLSVLMNNQSVVQQYYQQSLKENRILQRRIAGYSSPHGVEDLARNTLGMVGDGEILVRPN
jgi:cell division protein FtsB